MFGTARRLAVLGAIASVGSSARAARNPLTSIALPEIARLNEDGLPIHKGAPKINRRGYSVAQGKRMARKARNVKRHKAASRG